MKNLLPSSLRTAALVIAISMAPAAFAQNADNAAQLLAATGSVRVSNVGPYVSVGTYRVQVSAKLGHPTTTLADGTWLFENFNADASAAAGTLVVNFAGGRVSSLSLATRATVLALRTPQAQPAYAGVAKR
ncbi:MAG: hypothetical protein JWM32_814 [Verrucomicrobia bacterium]|nr:hypothetical protein [Verrucomicrobiota bacterium]